MRRITRSTQAVLARSATTAGLNDSDFQALVRIVAADGVSGAELGRMLGMTSSSITELADRLESTGMITRGRSRSDRRLVVLRATARGRRLMIQRALSPALTSMGWVLAELSAEERNVVGRFLDGVEQRLLELSGP